MTDFATDMASVRARANEILGRQPNPLMDVGMAALQSYGNPQQSFAGNLRAIQTDRARDVMGATSLLRSEAMMQNRDFANMLAAIRAQRQGDQRDRALDIRAADAAGRQDYRTRSLDLREMGLEIRNAALDHQRESTAALNEHRTLNRELAQAKQDWAMLSGQQRLDQSAEALRLRMDDLERRSTQSQARIDLMRDNHEMRMAELMSRHEDRAEGRDAKAITDALRIFAGDDLEARRNLFRAMRDQKADASNAFDIASQAASDLGIKKSGSAPRPYRVPEGEEIVTFQPDANAPGGRREIGRAPRTAARAGGPSVAQSANNEQIEAARQTLLSMNLTPAEIKRRQDPAERGYDPNLGRIVRMATQRKRAGDDPGFSDAWSRVYGAGSPAPTTTAALVPPASPAAPAAPAAPADDEALPMDANGGIEAMKLVPGRVYAVGGRRLRWDGSDFDILP